jgi:hypothetical protein
MLLSTFNLATFVQSNGFNAFPYNGYMIAGYFFMWLIVMIYIVILANRQRNIKDEVELLQQLLKEDEDRAGATGQE